MGGVVKVPQTHIDYVLSKVERPPEIDKQQQMGRRWINPR